MSMEQYREQIRQMVRKEFVSRFAVIKEAVYRGSNYPEFWNEFPTGTPTTEVTPSVTKHDFVRRVMKELNSPTNTPASRIYLEPEARANAIARLTPLMDKPDQFIEELNKERELFFGGGSLRSSPDPVATVLQQYVADKSVLKNLSSKAVANYKLRGGEEEEEAEPTASGEVEDAGVRPGGREGDKLIRDVGDMLAADPTEIGTTGGVHARLDRAKERLSKPEVFQLLMFLKNQNVSDEDKADALADIEVLNSLADEATGNYTELFVDSMLPALKGIVDVDNDDERYTALEKGVQNFVAGLKNHGVEKFNNNELPVFVDALSKEHGEFTVLDLLILTAKNPAKSSKQWEAAFESLKASFASESGKQTNFNSLGEFIDADAEVKSARKELFDTIVRVGRPAKSEEEKAATKLAAKEKAAAKRAEAKAAEKAASDARYAAYLASKKR